MRRRYVAILLLLVTSCGGDSPTSATLPSAIDWDPPETVVCLGTSLTYGWGSGCRVLPPRTCAADSSFPSLLQQRLRPSVINLGLPGATTADGAEMIEQALNHNPALVLLEFGANDLLQSVPAGSVCEQLYTMVRSLRSQDVAVVLLSFVHPDMVATTPPDHELAMHAEQALEYYQMLVSVTAQLGVPLIDNMLEGVWLQPELMYDGLHPNGRGYIRVEQNLFAELEPLLAGSGMLLHTPPARWARASGRSPLPAAQ